MIIEKLTQKYNVGCGKGQNYVAIPDIVFKLNLIVDKNNSTYPEPNVIKEATETEPEELEPVNKELELGDCFFFEGNVFAIDEDKLVQIVSETGVFAINRIFEEVIEPELELVSADQDDYFEFSWKEVLNSPENLKIYTPDYKYWKIWREMFVPGKNLKPEFTIKITVKDPIIGLERNLYFKNWTVEYNESDFDETELKRFLKKIQIWFYQEKP